MTHKYFGTDKELLLQTLNINRDVLVWKLNGVSETDARRPMVPSGTSLLGIVKHCAVVEYGWFCDAFGLGMEPFPFEDGDEVAEMTPDPDESIADILAFYARARVAADKSIADHDLDAVGHSGRGNEVSMRWVLDHMLEETARHAGHADILRELIDGEIGYRGPGDA